MLLRRFSWSVISQCWTNRRIRTAIFVSFAIGSSTPLVTSMLWIIGQGCAQEAIILHTSQPFRRNGRWRTTAHVTLDSRRQHRRPYQQSLSLKVCQRVAEIVVNRASAPRCHNAAIARRTSTTMSVVRSPRRTKLPRMHQRQSQHQCQRNLQIRTRPLSRRRHQSQRQRQHEHRLRTDPQRVAKIVGKRTFAPQCRSVATAPRTRITISAARSRPRATLLRFHQHRSQCVRLRQLQTRRRS